MNRRDSERSEFKSRKHQPTCRGSDRPLQGAPPPEHSTAPQTQEAQTNRERGRREASLPWSSTDRSQNLLTTLQATEQTPVIDIGNWWDIPLWTVFPQNSCNEGGPPKKILGILLL